MNMIVLGEHLWDDSVIDIINGIGDNQIEMLHQGAIVAMKVTIVFISMMMIILMTMEMMIMMIILMTMTMMMMMAQVIEIVKS